MQLEQDKQFLRETEDYSTSGNDEKSWKIAAILSTIFELLILELVPELRDSHDPGYLPPMLTCSSI